MLNVLVFLLSLFVVSSAYAGQEEFFEEVSATDTNTNVAISLTQSNDKAHSVTIVNDDQSTDEVYYDTSDGVATTDNAYLKPGESRTIDSGGGAFPITNVGIICDTGETATVRVFALPSR
jgi:hypothetical protein